jgi:hypothetical protein
VLLKAITRLSTFQGESRFFITREECPACCGLGYVLEDEEDASPPGDQAEPSPPHDPPK